MGNLDTRIYRFAIGYFALAAVAVLVARLGLFPGTGEAFPGDPTLGHPYRLSMGVVIAVLAIGLGALTAWAGAVAGNWTVGLGALVVGGVVTGALLGLAPWIYYPDDQYPVAFMWLMAGAPMGLASWAATSAALHLGRRAES